VSRLAIPAMISSTQCVYKNHLCFQNFTALNTINFFISININGHPDTMKLSVENAEEIKQQGLNILTQTADMLSSKLTQLAIIWELQSDKW
jgi:hypothetical protein